ncbi:YheC/YheD family protein [Bacillus sp. B15-48]|uniref:YheC/YheD family endospore coat-associated protein n=1 Tax=Bacillus sp. B15-48 TaxID=1548601 RepID=UPI00193ED6B1|nr:YheC/YheD family protein [Bacillus sp. B15-48]MBM4765349.1 hypothetical protein [Bacillus sp. B15-48]
MLFRLLRHDDSINSIKIHPATAIKWQVPSAGMIAYGRKSLQYHLVVDESLNDWQISLPHHIISHLGIPLCNPYELAIQKDKIRFGPYIGFLIGRKVANIERKLRKYIRHYDQLGGTLVAFNRKGLRKEMIDGYIYNQEKKRWERSTFSYPSSIFRLSSLPWNHHLYSSYRNKICNQRGFDKWLVHKNLSELSTINTYLPETTLLKDRHEIDDFLQRHRTLYIKPVGGSGGRRIIKISQENNSYYVRWREGKRRVKSSLMNQNELDAFLLKQLKARKYILQQGVELMSDKNRLIDFRLIISKNEKGIWHDFGLIGKYGVPDSIVSNISSGGKAEMGEITLKKAGKMTDEEVSNLRERISHIAFEIVKGMEKTFKVSYGDFALDFGVERNGKIWLIEVNPLGDHTIALDAQNQKLFDDIIKANLMYMKKLAGFGEIRVTND